MENNSGRGPAQQPMNPSHIRLVKRTFTHIAPNSREIGSRFYTRLFELDPKLRALFQSGMRDQGQAMFSMVDLIVRTLDFQEQLVPIIYDLGRRHATYGIAESDYLTFRRALLDTLEAALAEAFTPEVQDAWGAAYDFMAGVMKQAHHHVLEGKTLPYRRVLPLEQELDQ